MPQDSEPHASVLLTTGEEVPLIMVKVLMLSLEALLNSHTAAFYELAMACRDREHVLWGGTGEALTRLSLIDDIDSNGRARIHDLCRAIVLAAVKGDGLEMHLEWPVATT